MQRVNVEMFERGAINVLCKLADMFILKPMTKSKKGVVFFFKRVCISILEVLQVLK